MWHRNRKRTDVTPAADWAVPNEAEKSGAGVLLFAYGAQETLNHFLSEATAAARSFRQLNPSLQIAVVSNNASVDTATFTQHIKPRPDLLFAGSRCPYQRGAAAQTCKGMPRQWATRLYYMAMTPFELTWALDSNSVSCTANAMTEFLAAAYRSSLWGFDIAHANQHRASMYPHNWNILYLWSPRTSALMRDWLLLQMRRGITTDDQATLHAAEQRARRVGSGVRVGQMPTRHAAAFYSASPKRGWFPRITRPLEGPADVVHCKGADCQSWCQAFASAGGTAGAYQLMMVDATAAPPRVVRGSEACATALNATSCPIFSIDYERGRGAANEVFRPRLGNAQKFRVSDLKW